MGTPGYAAPEQFGFSQSDPRTDIYAVGVLLNVLLTGKLPHEQHCDGVYGKIVSKCIQIDSKQRYMSMEELRNAVRNKVEDQSAADSFIKKIPGIRSKRTPVVVISVIGYIFAIIFSKALILRLSKIKRYRRNTMSERMLLEPVKNHAKIICLD